MKMQVLTYTGFGVFDLSGERMKIIDFADTKKQALEKALNINQGDDIVIYKIQILRDEKYLKFYRYMKSKKPLQDNKR